jgi:hypothetical protein
MHLNIAWRLHMATSHTSIMCWPGTLLVQGDVGAGARPDSQLPKHLVRQVERVVRRHARHLVKVVVACQLLLTLVRAETVQVDLLAHLPCRSQYSAPRHTVISVMHADEVPVGATAAMSGLGDSLCSCSTRRSRAHVHS